MSARQQRRNQGRLIPAGAVQGRTKPDWACYCYTLVWPSKCDFCTGLRNPDLNPADRVFIGCFPTGLVFADRKVEEYGDYKRLAYMNYRTLVLEIEPDCPPTLRAFIEGHCSQYKKGQSMAIAGNMTITLGE